MDVNDTLDSSDLSGFTIAINSPEGDHLGFILMNLQPIGEANENYEGDCIFMVLPHKAELMDTPLVNLLWLYHFKAAGEHRVNLVRRAGIIITAEIIPKTERKLRLAFESDGTGNMWRLPDEIAPIAKLVIASDQTN